MAVQLKATIYCGLLIVLLHVVKTDGQFFMISSSAEIGKSSILHIYAIESAGSAGDVVITRGRGLPSNSIETGILESGGTTFGCFLRVHELNRLAGMRYGQYKGTFTVGEVVSNGYTFVKQKTGFLNTRGVQTITIYRMTMESNELAEDVIIGVGLQRGGRKLIWYKGRRKLPTIIGPKFTIETTDDAGLYSIRRRSRAKKGWFVQILVIAATCPTGMFSEGEDTCTAATVNCQNGGVMQDAADACICPPFLAGVECTCASSVDGSERILATDGPQKLLCEDLPGGNAKCKGHLICYGDNYGCKCSAGWWGNGCDRECDKGKWGANCEQDCSGPESACNRFYGPSSNLPDNGCS